MKRFLILIFFSLFFPIQNSSAVSPSLDETIEFLINGSSGNNKKWSINDCIVTYGFDDLYGPRIVNLNLVNLKSFQDIYNGFRVDCKGECMSYTFDGIARSYDFWELKNDISWKRNQKALSHLFSNFCEGFKSAF